jgi:hypothetical protein
MSDDMKQLRVLIDTYKLSRPVSPELQQYVIDSRMPDLRHILMKSGKYSLIAWLVIMIFSLFRKYGLHVTMIQSKIIAGITAAALASGSAAAVYGGARYIIKAAGGPSAQVEETVKEPEAGIKKHNETTPVMPEEQKRVDVKRTIPVYKEKPAPAGKKPQIKDRKGPAKKKKAAEEDAVSDIPTL